MPPGAGWRSELRRASRAGAQNSIRDAGALRAPAPTKDFFDFCSDFFELWGAVFCHFLTISVEFRGYFFLSSVFLSCVEGVHPWLLLRKKSQTVKG